MPLLQVRNMPEGLHQALVEMAKREHRSVAQQTVVLLRDALTPPEDNRARRRRVLEQIDADPLCRLSEDALDPVELIREDRDNR